MPCRDDEAAQILDAVGRSDISDQVLTRMLVDEAAAGVRAKTPDSSFQLLRRDLEAAHHRYIGADSVLTHLAADRDDLGDTWQCQKLGTHHEVGDLAQLHHRFVCRSCNRDQHDLAHDRGHGPHLRLDPGRQPALDERQTLGDLLAGAVDLHLPAELDVDDRQADARHGAHTLGTGHPVHHCLDRKGNELLDLLRRQTFRLGDQHNRRAVEVGEHIDGQARQDKASVGDKGQGCRQHHDPVLEARCNDELEHMGALTEPD